MSHCTHKSCKVGLHCQVQMALGLRSLFVLYPMPPIWEGSAAQSTPIPHTFPSRTGYQNTKGCFPGCLPLQGLTAFQTTIPSHSLPAMPSLQAPCSAPTVRPHAALHSPLIPLMSQARGHSRLVVGLVTCHSLSLPKPAKLASHRPRPSLTEGLPLQPDLWSQLAASDGVGAD